MTDRPPGGAASGAVHETPAETYALAAWFVQEVLIITAIPFKVAARRAGDPAVLVAANDQARTRLGWQAKWTDLEQIIESAWRWHRNPAF